MGSDLGTEYSSIDQLADIYRIKVNRWGRAPLSYKKKQIQAIPIRHLQPTLTISSSRLESSLSSHKRSGETLGFVNLFSTQERKKTRRKEGLGLSKQLCELVKHMPADISPKLLPKLLPKEPHSVHSHFSVYKWHFQVENHHLEFS